MTATEFADLLHARRVGPRSWMARCPAHADSSPSLSIREPSDGRRILINCFSGCGVTAVLRASGLQLRDLFAGPPPTPAQARKAAAERQEQERRQQKERVTERVAFDRIRKLHAIADELGCRLANDPAAPGSDAVAQLFHDTLDKIRKAEAVLGE
jgi:hypothetical protein